LADKLKEPIILSIYENSDKTDWSNYRGISLLPTSCKISSYIVLSRLMYYFVWYVHFKLNNNHKTIQIPYINEIIEDRQCGFIHNNE
jgi:hypothetical protein